MLSIKELSKLTTIEINVLIASIIGDGEITKIYKGSRRKNNSYREHYGLEQYEYRKWKQHLLSNWLYFTPKSQSLRSASHKLFTELYSHFYDQNGRKKIPHDLLSYCKDLYFPAVLYMDDGSLSINRSINHLKKRIYLTPHIFLYLQNYSLTDLQHLQAFLFQNFGFNFSINKRKDGYGHILRFTSTKNTYRFLEELAPVTKTCPSMYYKTNWEWRFTQEKIKLNKLYPKYEVIASSSERSKEYSLKEIETIISMKLDGETDKSIAEKIGRTYWSVVYKIGQLRKKGLLM